MIKGMNGYNEAQATNFASSELPKLAPGGYVLGVQAVKVEETQYGARIAFKFDIVEGEQKGFFKRLYDMTPKTWGEVKWKGTYRIYIPQNKGDADKYAKAVSFFKSQIEAFEQSNPGLKINASGDWDEQILAKRYVGAIFNEKEWEMNGKTGFFTQCKRFVSVNDIRTGNFTIPKADLLKRNNAGFGNFGGYANASNNAGGFSNYLSAEIPPVPNGLSANAPTQNPQGSYMAPVNGEYTAASHYPPEPGQNMQGGYSMPTGVEMAPADFQVFGGDDSGVPF